LSNYQEDIQKRLSAGCCELTGIPFSVGERAWNSPSLDRIDPALGYAIENTRIVILAINVMMNNWGESVVVKVTEAMKAHRQKDWLAHRLKISLARIGSTEREMIWSEKATPSGLSVWQLAPWTPPTFDSGSGGAQSIVEWATPCAHERSSTPRKVDHGQQLANQMVGEFYQAHWPTPEAGAFGAADPQKIVSRRRALAEKYGNNGFGLTLGQSMAISEWPTPTVSDVTGGRATRSGDRNNELLLNGLMQGGPFRNSPQTWATPAARDWRSDRSQMTSDELYGTKGRPLARQITEASGWTPNGSSAPTEKRGAPNPVFACWLMGWPDALISGALQAIQSFRSLPRKFSARSKTKSTPDDLFG
jgi:hypothetical protein